MQYEEAVVLASSSSQRRGYDKYLPTFVVKLNGHRSAGGSDGNECYASMSEPIQLVVIVSKGGEVIDVVSKDDTPASRCFRRHIVGLKAKRPPHAPLAIELTMIPKRRA